MGNILSTVTFLKLNENGLELVPIVGKNRHVRSLLLERNDITDIRSIGSWSQLTELTLASNQITTIPVELGKCRMLRWLAMNGNRIDEVEIGAFAGLKHLERLALGSNLLLSLPEDLAEMVALEWMDLTHNRLQTLPDKIGACRKLRGLGLGDNRLSTLPDSFARLIDLRKLGLFQNRLREVPKSLCCLTKMVKLDLSHNQLSTLPPEIGNLTRLKWLNICSNRITELPAEMGRLTQLQELGLGGNLLATLPPQCCKGWRSLRRLTLHNNRLVSLPNEIGQTYSLMRLDLSENLLVELPDSMGQLSLLHNLNLRNNRLPCLPECVLSMINLRRLDISNNQIVLLPTALKEHSGLKQFRYANNPLHVEQLIVDKIMSGGSSHRNTMDSFGHNSTVHAEIAAEIAGVLDISEESTTVAIDHNTRRVCKNVHSFITEDPTTNTVPTLVELCARKIMQDRSMADSKAKSTSVLDTAVNKRKPKKLRLRKLGKKMRHLGVKPSITKLQPTVEEREANTTVNQTLLPEAVQRHLNMQQRKCMQCHQTYFQNSQLLHSLDRVGRSHVMLTTIVCSSACSSAYIRDLVASRNPALLQGNQTDQRRHFPDMSYPDASSAPGGRTLLFRLCESIVRSLQWHQDLRVTLNQRNGTQEGEFGTAEEQVVSPAFVIVAEEARQHAVQSRETATESIFSLIPVDTGTNEFNNAIAVADSAVDAFVASMTVESRGTRRTLPLIMHRSGPLLPIEQVEQPEQASRRAMNRVRLTQPVHRESSNVTTSSSPSTTAFANERDSSRAPWLFEREHGSSTNMEEHTSTSRHPRESMTSLSQTVLNRTLQSSGANDASFTSMALEEAHTPRQRTRTPRILSPRA
eukprot:Clim_evm29s237 gene=Clim_evmTU29s237